MAVDKIILELQADVKGFKAELGNVRKELDSTQKKVADTGKAATQNFNQVGNSVRELGTAIGIAFGVQQLIQFGKASVSAYVEAERNAKLLLFALNGNVEAQQRLIEQSARIQKTTIYSDDQIQQAQTFLANQGMTEQQIMKTIDAAIELATVTGGDLQTTTEQLSATYEGSIGRLGKLDSGFKTLTKEQLANGAAVDLVIEKYKGLAGAAGQTAAGQIIIFQNALGDLQEEIGQALLPTISGLVESLTKFLQGLEPGEVQRFISILGDLVKIFTAYKIATAAAELANGGLVKSFNTLKVAMATNPFGLLVAGITTLITLMPDLIDYFDQSAESANKSADGVNNLTEKIKQSNKELNDHLSRTEKINEAWNKYINNKSSLSVNELKDAIQALNIELENSSDVGERQVDLQKSQLYIWDASTNQLVKNEKAQVQYTETQEEANKRQKEHNQELINQRAALQNLLNQKNKNIEGDVKQVSVFEMLNKQLDTAKKLLMEQILTGKNYTNTQQTIYDLTNRLTKAQEDYNNALKMSNITNLETLDIEESKPELIDATAGAYTRYADAIQKTIEKQQQANAIDPTEAQKKALEQANSVATGIGNVASSLGDLFVSIGEMAAQEGQKNAAFQKTLTIFAIQLKLAESIANVIANITKNSTDPLTIAANIISGIAAITTAIAQTSAIVNKAQVPQYADGTAFVGLNGNPKGIDTIPAYLNEGEAVIPTEMNKKYPGLASSWIKGNLDEYIMSNWVAPAVEQQRNKDLANNIAEALKINGMFDDYRLYRSLEKNSSINQSGFHSLAKAINKNNKKRGGYA